MYVERNMQMSSDLVTNQISLLNSHSNAHRKYERFAYTIRIGLKYLSTSHVGPADRNINIRQMSRRAEDSLVTLQDFPVV